MKTLTFESESKQSFINVTDQVRAFVKDADKREGLVALFLPHTTAGLLINDKLPEVSKDMLLFFDEYVKQREDYSHEAGNTPAHIKSALLGNNLLVPFSEKELLIGAWQAIYVCEFDGPKGKRLHMTII